MSIDIYFHQEGNNYFFRPDVKVNTKWIAFDLDWTLAYPRKELYPHDPNDIFLLPGRKEKLTKCIQEGYTLCIFTNQLAKLVKEKSQKLLRVQNFLSLLGLPVFIFVATGNDSGRKPEIGMFEMAVRYLGKPSEVTFVGDAMGRPQDFSNSDLIFAQRIGAKALTPEEFFPPVIPEFKCSGKCLILLSGPPGAGKSTFARRYLSVFQIWEGDQVGKRLLKLVETSLAAGKSVVVDATNPDRSGWYALAQKHSAEVIVLHFARNGFMYNQSRNPEKGEKKVPKIAYFVYYKKFVPFTQNEHVFEVWY